MNILNWITCLSVGLALTSLPAAAQSGNEAASPRSSGSTTAGTITGRVQNVATEAYLEGAAVTLEPSGRTTLTARDGSFIFSSLPAADYRVSVSYTGLDSTTVSIALPPGQTVSREIPLTSQIYAMSAFTVAGEREGNALAITQQRNAPNVKTVLSADAFGNIADQNIGNLLVRLPGIAEEIGEGEIVSVSIRGIASDMNAVTMDGTRGANGATGAMTRGFSVDRIPADFVDRIEVTKALTPDMDGDSIGGAINLKTKSSLDRKGRTITYMAGTSWNLDRDTFQPVGSFLYSDVLKEDQLGILVTSSFNKTHKPRDAVYLNWQANADTTRPSYFWMGNLGEDLLKHTRIGLGVRLDYKFDSTHRIFLNTMYSHYKDTMDRRQTNIGTLTAATVRPGWTDTVTETINHPLTYLQNHRKRTVETINLHLGGEKRFSENFLDYGVSYSTSKGTEDRVIPNRLVNGVGYRFDRSDSKKYPTVQQISGPDVTDLNNQRISSLNFQDFDDTDSILGANIDWKKQFSAVVPASIKTGVRYRGQERDRVQMRSYYVHVGADGVAGLNAATGINDDNIGRFADPSYVYRSADGRYDPVTSIDPNLLVRDLLANPTHYTPNVLNTTRDSLQFNGLVKEDVYAAYFMGDVRLGKLDILGGLRVEETRLSGRGVRQEITPEEAARRRLWVGTVTSEELRRRTIAEWSNIREESGEYRNVLPSLHFKYNAVGGLLARASYSTGLGRPNFSSLLRTTTVNHDSMVVNAANPDLRPQTAENFDLSLEYYFEPAGFVSAGVFLKNIKDFIYGDRGGVIGDGPNNGFDGDYVGYDLVSQFNGGSARVRGFEIAYQQSFNFLPGMWKGFGLMANYTWLESRGNYTSAGVTTGAQLAGFVPRTMNVGLSYAYRAWDVRVKMNFRGDTLYAYSSVPTAVNYRFSKTNYDLNLKYNWSSRLSMFMDVINIFDAPIDDTYLYVRDRNRFSQLFTVAIKAGISGRF